MSEFPALKDALVRAGERRRRRRRAVRVTVPAFAVAAAAGFVFALPHTPDRERVLEPSVNSLARDFAVFGRPQTDDDRTAPTAFAWGVRDVDVDPALTRHVGGDVFALATRAQDVVCLMVPDQDGRLNGPCGRADQVRSEHGGLRLNTDTTLALLFPNGTRDALAVYSNGDRVGVDMQDNAVVVPLPERVNALSWTSPRDVRHVLRLSRSRLVRIMKPCRAAFGALPPDAVAKARRVALDELDQLHPSATTGQVRRAEVVRDGACRDAVPNDAVAVTLSTDGRPRELRVLVAAIDNVLQPYRVMR